MNAARHTEPRSFVLGFVGVQRGDGPAMAQRWLNESLVVVCVAGRGKRTRKLMRSQNRHDSLTVL